MIEGIPFEKERTCLHRKLEFASGSFYLICSECKQNWQQVGPDGKPQPYNNLELQGQARVAAEYVEIRHSKLKEKS